MSEGLEKMLSPDPRPLSKIREYNFPPRGWDLVRKYEENMKKYVKNMKKYEGNMKEHVENTVKLIP